MSLSRALNVVLSRRSAVAFLLATAISHSFAQDGLATTRVITDGAGRQVVLPKIVKKMILIGSTSAEAFLLIHPDPRQLIVGATQDVYALFEAENDKNGETLEPIKVVVGSGATISLETIVKLAPDLIVLPNDYTGFAAVLSQLEKINIPYVFLSRSGQLGSLDEAARSQIRVAGSIVDAGSKAELYIDFYDRHYAALKDRVGRTQRSPHVLSEMHADYTKASYISWGKLNFDIAKALGATSIGAELIPADWGTLSPEAILAANPEIYIAFVGSYTSGSTLVALGPGVERTATQASLVKAISRRGISGTSAARTRNAHAVSLGMSGTPLNIVLFEVIAKWLHPEVFSDLNPEETLRYINSNFRAKPLKDTYWVSLDPVKGEIE